MIVLTQKFHLYLLGILLLEQTSSIFAGTNKASESDFKRPVPQSNAAQRFKATPCEDICKLAVETMQIDEDMKPDCERGCFYFNTEFLVESMNNRILKHDQPLNIRCRDSCSASYKNIGITNKKACFVGCEVMMSLQGTIPNVDSYPELDVAGGRDVPEYFLRKDDDLDDFIYTLYKPGELKQMFDDYEKSESADIQSVPVRPAIGVNYCIPTWMYMVLILLIVAMILFQYGHLCTNMCKLDYFIDVTAVRPTNDASTGDHRKPSNDFIVSSDSYFYPMPAVPPPKYNEAAEAMLHSSDDDEMVLPLTTKDNDFKYVIVGTSTAINRSDKDICSNPML